MALDYKNGLARYRRYLQVVQEKPLWRASIFLIFSLSLAVVMLVAALRPTLITIAGLLGQIKEGESIDQQLDRRIHEMEVAMGHLGQIRERLPLLDIAIPNQPHWETFINSVNKAASDSGVEVTTINIDSFSQSGKDETTANVKPLMPNGITPIDMTITVTGDYVKLREFESRLENLRRLWVISGVEFGRSDKGILSATIKGTMGYYKDTNQQP